MACRKTSTELLIWGSKTLRCPFLECEARATVMGIPTPCQFSFLCLRYEVAGGIMFSGCPSVRPSVRTYVPFSWSRYLKNRLMDSCQTLVMYVSCRADERVDFGVTRSKVKGHRAHYVCKNSSWSRYLKNRLMDSCQTLVMYVSCRADELIRFWGHEVKGHRTHYVCKNSSWSRYLKNRLKDSCQTKIIYVTCRANELIRFWGHEVKGQRPQRTLCMQKQLVIAFSRTDRWIPAKLRSCMLLAELMNWLDFGVMRSRSKVMRLIMYAKIACDRIIIRTDWWIPAKLRSFMYLAEPMNWVDSWFIRSKVKGHGLIMYAKIACERILIRTDRWITI